MITSDIELATYVAMFITVLQALLEFIPSFEVLDNLALEVALSELNDIESMQLAISAAALHDRQLCCGLLCVTDDLRYWVKPRSTTWFNEFLVNVYDDRRWIQMFRMSKASIAELCNALRPVIQKQETKFRVAIPVEVRVCCAIYKLAQGANIGVCSELFAIGRSTVGKVLREVVRGICLQFKQAIQWPTGQCLRDIMQGFQDWCGLPSVHGAIDCTQIKIRRPNVFAEDYYYYKSGCYTIVTQAVVDYRKCFTDIFVGLPGSVNDMRVLRKSGLYRAVQEKGLMDMLPSNNQDGIPPYLLGDKGYPLLSWILTPVKDDGHELSVIEYIYNKKHRRGRSVVENAFGILKQSWRELLHGSELDVKFIPDVVVCCCVLHNLLIGGSEVQLEELMQVLHHEAEHDIQMGGSDPSNMYDDATRQEYNGKLKAGELAGDEYRRNVVAYVGHLPLRR